MVFTKDDLAVMVTCFTEKRWTGTLNPLDYSICDISLLQELVYKGRREPFANLKDLQKVIRHKWHDVDHQTMRKGILQWKKVFSSSGKAELRTYLAHSLLISLTDDYCDDLT